MVDMPIPGKPWLDTASTDAVTMPAAMQAATQNTLDRHLTADATLPAAPQVLASGTWLSRDKPASEAIPEDCRDEPPSGQ
jgi:hypothetical protein